MFKQKNDAFGAFGFSEGVYKLVTIRQNFPTSGYSGSENWVSWPTQYQGMVQIGSGREYYGAKKINSELDALLQLTQHVKGLNEKMRINIDNIDYEIISVSGVRELGYMEVKLRLVR